MFFVKQNTAYELRIRDWSSTWALPFLRQGHDMSSMKKGVPAMGQPGEPAKVTQTIEIVMEDTMRFTPSEINVKAGDTGRFLIKNSGKVQIGRASCRERVCQYV